MLIKQGKKKKKKKRKEKKEENLEKFTLLCCEGAKKVIKMKR